MASSTIGSAIQDYLFVCRTEAKSPETVRWYQQKLEYFASFLNRKTSNADLRSLDRDHIRAFIRHLQTEVMADQNNPRKPTRGEGLSPNTIHGYARALRAFLSWACRDGLIEANPMSGISMPKVPSRVMPAFTDTQVSKLLAGIDRRTHLGVRNYTMILLLLDTGIRVSELVGLNMPDLHLHEGYFKVRAKGNKERIVPMGVTARQALWRYVRKHRPQPALPTARQVFPSRSGMPISGQWVYKIVATACRTAGIRGVRRSPYLQTYVRQ